jgi:hypothetical protein
MNTTIRRLLCVLALACGTALSPAQDRSAGPAGTVLVLVGERTLEGTIDKVGNDYRVRRPHGELTIPANQVLRLCADLDEAFAYVRSRANLNDPDERLRLADWCHVRNLNAQALAEVAAAAALRPGHGPTQRRLAHLRAALNPEARPPAPAPAAEPEPPPPSLDLGTEALCVFNTKVQPVLMNACASCHATGKGGAFKLTRASSGVTTGSRVVQQNVVAVLSQVNLQQPQGSPLLLKAVTAHGSLAQAPLKSRQAPAYRLLEEWVKQTVETNPQLREKAGLPPAAPPPVRPIVPAAPVTEEKTPPSTFGSDQPQEPTEPAGPVDPFDPIIFNRQMHPDRK